MLTQYLGSLTSRAELVSEAALPIPAVGPSVHFDGFKQTLFPSFGSEFRSGFRLAALILASLTLVAAVAHVSYSVRLFAQETATELYIIGTELVDGGDYPTAIETLQRAAYMDRSDARIYYELGNAYYFDGADPYAAVAWAEALRLDPAGELGQMAAGLARPLRGTADRPPVIVHADPREVWNRSWNLSIWGFSHADSHSVSGFEVRAPFAWHKQNTLPEANANEVASK